MTESLNIKKTIYRPIEPSEDEPHKLWPKAQCTTILQINLVILNLQLASFSHSLHYK